MPNDANLWSPHVRPFRTLISDLARPAAVLFAALDGADGWTTGLLDTPLPAVAALASPLSTLESAPATADERAPGARPERARSTLREVQGLPATSAPRTRLASPPLRPGEADFATPGLPRGNPAATGATPPPVFALRGRTASDATAAPPPHPLAASATPAISSHATDSASSPAATPATPPAAAPQHLAAAHAAPIPSGVLLLERLTVSLLSGRANSPARLAGVPRSARTPLRRAAPGTHPGLPAERADRLHEVPDRATTGVNRDASRAQISAVARAVLGRPAAPFAQTALQPGPQPLALDLPPGTPRDHPGAPAAFPGQLPAQRAAALLTPSAETLDPDLLAELVNEALLEQARRHGALLP